ncbi:MAG: ABC transporter ATP-binding protein [Planctomycetota bacterium]|nr:ABC transporter ATP-binding protein [Planctomycetota bacterium]
MSTEIVEVFKKRYSKNWKEDIFVLWQLSLPYIWRLVAAVLCSAMLSGVNGAVAWLIKPVLDSLFIKKASGFLFLLPFGVVTLFFLRGTFAFLTDYLMSSIGAKIVRSLRQGIYSKLLVLPLSFYNETSSGSVMSKVFNDIETLKNTVADTVKDFFVSGGTVIVLTIVAITRKWDLTLMSIIVIPLIIFSIAKFGTMMKRTSMKTRKLISKVTIILHESLRGMKIIKAFTMEKEMTDRHENALTDHYRNTMREVRINAFSSLMTEVFGGIGVAIILFYGGHLVISGEISSGEFLSFITAILMIYTPLKRLSRLHNDFQQARNVIQRVREIVLVEPERKGGIEKEIRGHIIFENVSYLYPSAREYAVNNINLEIMPGELIALVGHSGAGKSTLVDLLAGFWYPNEGHIIIDDINTRDLSLKSLRRHLGIVTQDMVLFNDASRANILFGRPDATDEEVIEAAKAAYAHEFIMELPEGYETKIGEHGVKLSGGQKQRITIARAILRNPTILILDEATASLDTESEQKVQKALERLMTGRTTIVIAHRLSTVKKATRIIVMNKGRIVQQGAHDELLLQGGLYQELYNMQFASLENKEK